MAINAHDYQYIRSLLSRKAGIVLEGEKAYLVESRLLPLAQREGLDSIAALVAQLRGAAGNGLIQRVVEAMTTNETSFFRDFRPFDVLREIVLPELIERRRTERRLTIWSAAASTGQEPYSIAVMLREQFPELAGWDVRIIATDVSTEVLERAREGVYSQHDVHRGLRASVLLRNFRPLGTDWRITDTVKRQVEFRQLNLIEPWPPMPPLDIVFMRNVLIYFDVATKKTLLGRVRKVLRPDGFLFLGGAETTVNLDENFERLPQERSSCFRLRNS